MMVNTVADTKLSSALVESYFRNLVNRFYKILPMRENGEDSLDVYMLSLRAELLGCKSLIPELQENSLYLSLLSTLQYLIDTPTCTVKETKREVFGAISVCNKLKDIYSGVKKR